MARRPFVCPSGRESLVTNQCTTMKIATIAMPYQIEFTAQSSIRGRHTRKRYSKTDMFSFVKGRGRKRLVPRNEFRMQRNQADFG